MQVIPTCGVERRERFHKVHMGIEALAITSGKSAAFRAPITIHIFDVTAVQGVGSVLLQQIEGSRGVLQSSLVTGCQVVFAQGINAKAFAIRSEEHTSELQSL